MNYFVQRTNDRQRGDTRHCRNARFAGFTMLELIVVITLMMILMAIAVPLYKQHVVQAREAVLRSNVQQLNKLIQEYTIDKHQAPQSLDDLKNAGYVHEIPTDPMTGQADWDCEQEDTQAAADPQQPGIVVCHSHSAGMSADGRAYSSW